MNCEQVCWALTLAGGWWVVAGRLCAGLAGAVAWCIAPLLGREVSLLHP